MIWYSEQKTNSETKQILEEGTNVNHPQLDVQLRFLNPEDLEEVRLLCQESFPIEYPLKWYEEITSNSNRFFSLAAVYNLMIVGLIVAEIKPWNKLNKEDKTILAESLGRQSSLAYILSLGVHRKYRRNGIGSLLLQTLMEHLQSSEHNTRIKAIYLHVLTTNQPAILFYERRNFTLHSFLPYYYSINGRARDGFCYVCYVNGGHSSYTIFDHFKDMFQKLMSFGAFHWMFSRVRLVINWLSYHTVSKTHFQQ